MTQWKSNDSEVFEKGNTDNVESMLEIVLFTRTYATLFSRLDNNVE